jgi:hypothetical protein
LLWGLGWPRSKYYGIPIAKVCRAFLTPERGKKKKKKKKPGQEAQQQTPECITINNNRWCQDSKLLFIYLFICLFDS